MSNIGTGRVETGENDFGCHIHVDTFLFHNESRKRELKTKLIYEDRCDERLIPNGKRAEHIFFRHKEKSVVVTPAHYSVEDRPWSHMA